MLDILCFSLGGVLALRGMQFFIQALKIDNDREFWRATTNAWLVVVAGLDFGALGGHLARPWWVLTGVGLVVCIALAAFNEHHDFKETMPQISAFAVFNLITFLGPNDTWTPIAGLVLGLAAWLFNRKWKSRRVKHGTP